MKFPLENENPLNRLGEVKKIYMQPSPQESCIIDRFLSELAKRVN